MTIIRYLVAFGLVLGAAVSAAPARAEEGAYAGVAIGAATISEDRFLIDDGSRAFKLVGGYRFGEHLALQAEFVNFDDAVEVFDYNTPSQRAVADGRGFGAAVVGRVPFGRFSMTGKAGLLSWATESGFDGGPAENADGIDLSFGVGLRLALNDSVDLTADYEFYELGGTDVGVGLVGFSIRF